jgi:hypothetical protein
MVTSKQHRRNEEIISFDASIVNSGPPEVDEIVRDALIDPSELWRRVPSC